MKDGSQAGTLHPKLTRQFAAVLTGHHYIRQQ
jgi:hypothetical protein